MGETLEPLRDTIIISNQSSSAIMNSKGLKLDLLNHTAVGQVSRKDLEAFLFQFMNIVSNKQKMSFVEKFHLLEEKIMCLCNRIVHNATENQCINIKIDFKSLNQLSLLTIGFYGDK